MMITTCPRCNGSGEGRPHEFGACAECGGDGYLPQSADAPPPAAPDELERWGLPTMDRVATRCADGYWTPWHIAAERVRALEAERVRLEAWRKAENDACKAAEAALAEARELIRKAWRILDIDAPNDKTTEALFAFLIVTPGARHAG